MNQYPVQKYKIADLRIKEKNSNLFNCFIKGPIMQRATVLIIIFILLSTGTILVSAEPQPGDVFREYYWYNRSGDADYALRVGGKLDYGGGTVDTLHVFDLQYAVKAEVIIEKIQSHPDTKALQISINDNEWTPVLISENIPSPQYLYMHHTYPVMEIPLSWLHDSKANGFKMQVSTDQYWNWPQNLINGVHFRIYYDPTLKSHPYGEIVDPPPDSLIGDSVAFTAETGNPDADIRKVDYVGLYEDVNYEGDGIYYQWHYHYYHGKILHHIGTDYNAPYSVTWDTSWVPDQDRPIQVAARIIDTNSMIYMTEPVTGLQFDRGAVSVELCKPYNVSREWSTRKSGKGESFDITGNLNNAVAAQLVWTSWCPGYMNDIYINSRRVFDNEGPLYKYYFHRVPIDSLSVLNQGMNRLFTGYKKEINGVDIHGMEVQWPGMMVLLRYENDDPVSVDDSGEQPVFELTGSYPNPFNMSTTIRYSLHEQARVRCRIYSLSGQLVRTLVDDIQSAGTRETMWDGTDENGAAISTGMYLYNITAGGRMSTGKLLLIK